jgi:hypothetical protein
VNPAGERKFSYLSDISPTETQLSGANEIKAVTIITKKEFISVNKGII